VLPRRFAFAIGTAAALMLIGFLVYGQSLQNAFLTYDDDLFVTKHPLVTSGTWADVPQIFGGFDAELYMPLTIASLKLDYMLAGLNPFAFHLTSLLLHIAGSCLLTWLLLKVFNNKVAALFLGALFLVHPLNTEVVAWVAARKDVLSTPLFLGAAIAYLHSLDTGKRGFRMAALALFLLSLLAKYMTVSLPALLLILELLRGKKMGKDMVLRLAPFLGIAAVFTMLAAAGKQTGLGLPAMEIALMAGKTTLWYLRSFIFPAQLHILYLQETPIGWTAEFLMPWAVVIAIGIGCWLVRKHALAVCLGFVFFFIALIPTFAAALKYGVYFAADHYAYLPMIGLLLALGWVLQRVNIRTTTMRLTVIGCALLLTELGVASHAQARMWLSSETVFTRVLERYPCSIVALNNRAAWRAQVGYAEGAKKDFAAAVACEPAQARLRINYGMFLDSIGDGDGALRELNAALNIAPLSAETHFMLGVYFQKHGRVSDAKAAIENAIKLDPNYVERKMRNTAM
jgi:tetratricopeptide (TPR) repeat protein